MEAILAAIVLGVICVILAYVLIKVSLKYHRYKAEEKTRREEAIRSSRRVLGGKFTEQMAPYFPEFNYDPTEARFIGSPVDLIVFPGLAEDNPQEIVLIEVKAGKSDRLTPREQKVRQLVEAGMVRWELMHLPPEEDAED